MCKKDIYNSERSKHNCYEEAFSQLKDLQEKQKLIFSEKIKAEYQIIKERQLMQNSLNEKDNEIRKSSIIISLLKTDNENLLKKNIHLEEEYNNLNINHQIMKEENQLMQNKFTDNLNIINLKENIITNLEKSIKLIEDENNILKAKISQLKKEADFQSQQDTCFSNELNAIIQTNNNLTKENLNYYLCLS